MKEKSVEKSSFVGSLLGIKDSLLGIIKNPLKASKERVNDSKAWLYHLGIQTIVGLIAIIIMFSKLIDMVSGGFGVSISLFDILTLEIAVKGIFLIILNAAVWSFVYVSLVYLYVTKIAGRKEKYMAVVNDFIPLITFTFIMVLVMAIALLLHVYIFVAVAVWAYLFLTLMTYLSIKNKYEIKKENILLQVVPFIIILMAAISAFLDERVIAIFFS